MLEEDVTFDTAVIVLDIEVELSSTFPFFSAPIVDTISDILADVMVDASIVDAPLVEAPLVDADALGIVLLLFGEVFPNPNNPLIPGDFSEPDTGC